MTAPSTVSDVRDTPDELEALTGTPLLRHGLEVLDREIVPAFEAADRLALGQQRRFRRIALVAATFGTISLLLSVLGLVAAALDLVVWGDRILVAQVVFLVITAVAVLRGLFAFMHENWLVERYRAEQLRALKFARLMDPAVWSADGQARQDWETRVGTEVTMVRAIRHDHLAAISATEDVPPPSMPEAEVPDAATLDALVTYYERKRLAPQREYFRRASQERSRAGSRALPLVFFGALFLEVMQAILAVSQRSGGSGSTGAVVSGLAAASIGLPILWAGIRTYQGALEASRNAVRSHARLGTLTQLTQRLLATRRDPREALATMRLAEFVLHIDQREWLRLLREAEWYG